MTHIMKIDVGGQLFSLFCLTGTTGKNKKHQKNGNNVLEIARLKPKNAFYSYFIL
jgi:hypothetical protein